jgi:hypothetical protein
LQSFDGGGELGIEEAQVLRRMAVGVAHGGDLCQGEPEIGQALDASIFVKQERVL